MSGLDEQINEDVEDDEDNSLFACPRCNSLEYSMSDLYSSVTTINLSDGNIHHGDMDWYDSGGWRCVSCGRQPSNEIRSELEGRR